MAENYCGTGLWSGPKPGDPDNNLILSARPAFGGIDVTWTYPGINAHAVAHTILYRSTSGTEATKVQHSIVSGNFFYDKSDTATPIEYFYWIQIVSINGTIGELIGPASATARPTIEDTIIGLTGRIDAGVLAQSLKTEIGKIQLNKLAVDKELLALAEQDDALGAAYNEVVAFTEDTRALLQQETLARADANSAFVTNINTLYANMQGVVAAVQVETDARVTADKALASQITTTQSQLGDQIASVQVGMQTKIDTVNGKVTEIGALYTAKVDVNGLIGGFGVYNNGRTVEAGFDVDRFWIGRTQNKRKPFIIEGNEVFIDEAAINKLTFSKLRDESGSFVVQNGKAKANYLTVDTASIKDASITNAKIANASITAAKIGVAEVDTLRIRGNAVTVPSFVQGYGSYTSESWMTVLTLSIYLDQAAWLYAASSGYIGYGTGWSTTNTRLWIDGSVVSEGGGDEAWTNAAHSGAKWAGAGSHTVSLQFRSNGLKGKILYPTIFAMAVKR